MDWSISKTKTFQQCPRKWFFSERGWPSKKDKLRNEMYLFGQLRNIRAWRGLLVDTVIEKFIIPELKERRISSIESTIKYAMELAEKQLDFGLNKRYRDENMTKKFAGDSYFAFFEIEYNGTLETKEITKAKGEIEQSIKILLESEIIKDLIKKPGFLIAQRNLNYRYNDFNVLCKPDLLVFYQDEAPMIIDWKVHSDRNTDYWLQLGIYAYILSKIKPHRDFSNIYSKICLDPTKMKLIEFQLLKNFVKNYCLKDVDICDIEDYIFETGENMLYSINNGNNDHRNFPTANDSSSCLTCQYKKICWEE